VIGNKKGKIGTGLGKGLDVSSAVQKALSNARKNLIDIKFTGSTIAYEVSEKYGSAKVLLKPAPEGSGIVAGGAVRSIVELAGIKDITGKMLGSNNKICNVLCTLDALKKLRV
jgi:small subunit ribosomal protein S5